MTSRADDLAYVSNVARRAPILTREEETALARRFRDSGDPRAADTLVRAHLRMVIVVALRHRHYGIAASELVAEGNCGLVRALSKFDPERAVRFGTYAKHWVRAHILASVSRSLNSVGGTKGVGPRLFFKLRRERARIRALLGEGIEADEALAQRMNLSVAQLSRLLQALDVRCVSLDAPPGGEQNERLSDTLPSGDNLEEQYFHSQRRDVATSAVASALGVLDARERFIAMHRILVAPNEELSLLEIAGALHMSRERARQLEERTKHKLGRSRAIQRNSHLLEWFAD
jgi:RNA polymerase sigma-32 factor